MEKIKRLPYFRAGKKKRVTMVKIQSVCAIRTELYCRILQNTTMQNEKFDKKIQEKNTGCI